MFCGALALRGLGRSSQPYVPIINILTDTYQGDVLNVEWPQFA
jgi:hypothetical protein